MNEFKVTGESTSWDIWSRPDERFFSRDSSLFSSSLPVFRHENLNVNDHATIEDMLPNDDELLAGILNDLDIDVDPTIDNNVEEYDFFCSGGGLELESDSTMESLGLAMSSRLNLPDSSIIGNGIMAPTITGEHPFGEHPSRTLFVRNINSSIDDSELRELFQEYGDIRYLYTSTKHRGFVIISYYDIRAARAALRGLQDKPLRRRKLDIHFSIPKDNPSEKDLNQGTLVVFNLNPALSNEVLLKIFGAFGEVKEIRETPHKKHHKFIEYYDIRDADAAQRAMHRRHIAGRRIKLEMSRPGGIRRNHMVNSGQDLEQEEPLVFGSFSPGIWPPQLGSSLEQSPVSSLSKSGDFRSMSPVFSVSGFDSILQPQGSNSKRVAAPADLDHMLKSGNNGGCYRSGFQQPVSFPESYSSQFSGSGSSFGGSNSNGSGIGTFWGNNQFLWGSTSNSPSTNSSSMRGQSFGHHGPIGSAPSGARFEKQYVDLRPKDRNFTMNQRVRGNVSSSVNISDNSGYNTMASSRVSSTFFGYGRNNQLDNNNSKKFELDLEKIISGQDSRTTLMIKNIPNKYTSSMLLADIDENNKGTYDFFYLPIDFKNRCNVGYAFINLTSPSHIIPFYEAFNGRKWEKFNSGKVVFLAYARIQGKEALVSHFENSSLMNLDVQCRPIIFHPEEGSGSGSNCSKFQVRARSNGLVDHTREEASGRSKDEGLRCVDKRQV